MQRLNLPTFPLKIKQEGTQNKIFDDVRKKWLLLTPEEWVRQNFIQYLVHHKKYPSSLISVEHTLILNKQSMRSDIVVFNREAKPKVIVECKAPEVKINQQTFDQIAAYNLSLQVDYLIVTNGIKHYCCQMDLEKKEYRFLEEIPEYENLH